MLTKPTHKKAKRPFSSKYNFIRYFSNSNIIYNPIVITNSSFCNRTSEK